jgi:protein-S-isoprenylcysteine O-methyltransferase Ste14
MKYLKALGFCINTLAIYLAMPMLGWGISDINGFLSSPQRAGYAVVICATGIVIGIQSLSNPVGITGSPGKKGKLVLRQRIIRLAVTLMLFLGLAYLPYADRRDVLVMKVSETFRWIGLMLFTTGMIFIVWSGISLGRFYSPEVTIQAGHRLITDGLYRHIRHPRYAGGVLLGFGLAFLFRSWVGIIFSVCFIGLILFRIRDEETAMSAEFGEEWERYYKNTWRLLPKIY